MVLDPIVDTDPELASDVVVFKKDSKVCVPMGRVGVGICCTIAQQRSNGLE